MISQGKKTKVELCEIGKWPVARISDVSAPRGGSLGVGCQSSAKCWLAAQPDKTGANNHLTREWNALVPKFAPLELISISTRSIYHLLSEKYTS